ncbi:MAG: DUF4190 domain-containing protein [Aeromicrobium sp.]|uniref:DUF4190 domain-containing protein n=1 Tax=Aeromicrobium sp. TaxID=1871063 RepID=UPI003C3752B5
MTTNEPPQYPDYGSVPDQSGTPPPPPSPPGESGGWGPPPPGAPMGAPGGYGPPPQTLQKATWAMIIGIVSVLCCGPAGIAAIIVGHQAKKEIAASGGALAGQGQAQAGFVLGIVALVLTVVGVVFYVALFAMSGDLSVN